MPVPTTNQELLDLIARSGVLDMARVQTYLDKLAASPVGLPAEPAKLASRMVKDGVLTVFQAENLMAGRWKRFFIGKYKVLERIGVGGMGQVFLCEHKLMRRRVAVKVLPAAKAKDPASLKRFYREARAVAALDHPNIVRAYDIDQDESLHFLVMEYVEGVNLHDLVLKVGPLPVSRACHYIYGVAVGLEHAHENLLIHRDIKPANVLVDRTGVVKILDLGLARFFNPDEEDLLSKKFDETVIGTADYLSPEQAIDSDVDIRADIYGLGGTFYFLLTGQPPFPEGSVATKLLAHQSKEPTPISEFRADVPQELEAVIAKMMAKDPALRYQTPDELMAVLSPWVQAPISPPSDAELPRLSIAAGTTRPTGSSKTPVATTHSGPTSATVPPAIPRRATPITPRTAPQVTSDNPWESITSSPAGSDDSSPFSVTAGGAESTDTDPIVAPSSRTQKLSGRRKSPPVVVIIGLILGGLILLVAAVVAVILVWKPFAQQ